MFFIRIAQFGAMLVSNTQEYHNNRNGNTFDPLSIELPIYLGGIPDDANSSVLMVSQKSFFVWKKLKKIDHKIPNIFLICNSLET